MIDQVVNLPLSAQARSRGWSHNFSQVKQSIYLFLCLLFIATGCDKGLAPPPPQPSIEGKVRFLSEWPHKDSLGNRFLVLALAKVPPPYAAPQLLAGVFDGTVLTVIPTFNYGTRDTNFYFELDTGTYYYLGVAQQFGGDVNKDWRVLGFAHDELDSARVFHIGVNDHFKDILIDVRFDSLPRQPFIK